MKKVDLVNHPPHYNQNGIECIDGIESALGDGFEFYLAGNCMKYLWRYKYKGKPLEDLQKAEWYSSRLINVVKNEEIEDSD